MHYVSNSVKIKFKNIQDEMVKRILAQEFDFKEIGIFGSYARGDYNALSDVDICVIVKDIPKRSIMGWLRDDAEEVGADICFITEEQFEKGESKFICNIRKDYKRIYYGRK